MASVTVFQRKKQLEKHGRKKTPWTVVWRDPDGKQKWQSFGCGVDNKRTAERFADKVRAALLLGVYEADEIGKKAPKKPKRKKGKSTWDAFFERYKNEVMAGMSPKNFETYNLSIRHFIRIVKPVDIQKIDEGCMDQYTFMRKSEPGQKKGDLISPATLHKELTCLRSMLRKAKRWKHIDSAPEIDFPKIPVKIKSYVSSDEFSRIYSQCDGARLPDIKNVSPGDWWRGFLTVCFLTGWRLSQILAIKWDHIDLDELTILSPNDANKGRRDVFLPLHPVIAEHLKPLKASFDEFVFPINRSQRRLYYQFHELQEAAEIKPKHKDSYYGFHDLRRGFATANADTMDLLQLQELMQHKSLKTTQIYVSMAKRLNQPVANLLVPEMKRG